MLKRKSNVFYLLTLVVIFGSVSFFYYQYVNKVNPKFNFIETIDVEAERVKIGDMYERRTYSGSLKAQKSISLINERGTGIIKYIRKDGEVLKKGDYIFKLNDSSEQNAAESAKAVLEENKLQRDRAEDLNEQGIVSDSELETRKNAYNKALAEYNRTVSELEKTKFIAPFDGILGLVKYTEGAVLYPNQEISTFRSVGPLVSIFSVPESDANSISIGTEIYIISESSSILPQLAKIDAIDAVSDSTHNIAFKATLINENVRLIPGQFVKVDVPLGIKKNVLMVPESAVKISYGSSYVYKVEDGVTYNIPVEIGIRDEGYVEILKGLEQGNVVVTEAGDGVSDGQKVKANIAGESN
ncbi:efflux RND transporter periplasmic adaptor subunit [Candidatus Nesciobacter abundans]|uniref:Efflux RND transporter periplasmic adaptor subunit n=1 Tax=Candidatus Nesciobacter abundans TaxID=2601668 RepID=A0A5C0UH61_9PROT|nr:efflux RND transporter periplasmic adaptor subunit [Candidatus Nesciobacter abundans]QEK38893.1 efflux RND transporter periplasmic adaptor subunit [Candidatus Nesciobacter abundans]